MITITRHAANHTTVHVGTTSFTFSYDTCVAFRHDGVLTVSENLWGPTTGQHLNTTGIAASDRIPRAEFEKRLEKIRVVAR